MRVVVTGATGFIGSDHGLSFGNRERLCAHVRWELQRGEAPGT